jgi:anti-sigma B factor antagonist
MEPIYGRKIMTEDYSSPKDIIKKAETKDGVVVLELQGEIDMSNSPVLRTKILEVFQGTPNIFVINMTEIGYMDSSGLGTLVEALKWSNRKDTQLKLVGVNDNVKSVFEISRLTSIFQFYDTQEEALS